MESAESVLDAVLRAVNGFSSVNLVSELGLDRTMEFGGVPMLPPSKLPAHV